MFDDEAQTRLLRFLGKVAAYALLLGMVLWTVWQIRGIFPPFLVAFLFAVALSPVADRLEARGMPRWLAAGLAFLTVFGTIGGLLFLLIPMIYDQIGQIVADLRGHFRLDQPADISRTMTEQIRIFGRKYAVPDLVLHPMITQAKSSASIIATMLEQFGTLLLRFIPNLIWVVLVPIIALYAVIDYHRTFAKLLVLFPRSSRDSIRGIAADVSEMFGKYLRGLGIVCLLDAVATILLLLIFPATRPYAVALGAIAGLLYAVPYLGAIISTALISLVALASPDGGSFATMIWVTFSMVLLHQVFFDQVVSPRVLGAQVGLHPILSIMALMAGDALFGIGGMLLAVPFAASLQVLIVHALPHLARTVHVRPPVLQNNDIKVEDAKEILEEVILENKVVAQK